MASRTKEHNKNSKIKNKTGKFKSAKEINQEVKNPRWKIKLIGKEKSPKIT